MAKQISEWENFAGQSHSAVIWQYFERRKSKKDARCKKCQKVLKISTSTMKYHITNFHKIKIDDMETELIEIQNKRQPKITSLITSREATLN